MGERSERLQRRTSPVRALLLAALWICGGCRMGYEEVIQVVAVARAGNAGAGRASGDASGGSGASQAGTPSNSQPGGGGTSPSMTGGGTSPNSIIGGGGTTRASGTAGDGGTTTPGAAGSLPGIRGGGTAGILGGGTAAGGGVAGSAGGGSCPCDIGRGCVGATCVPGKIVFVTSQTVSATFGGLAGADQLCADLAKSASLPGTYLVWLSDSRTSPAARFSKSRIPYVLVSGVVVASDWEDLIDGQLSAPINVDDRGNLAIAEEVWTSTYANGTAATNHCSDWTSADVGMFAQQGVTDRVDSGWTEIYLQFCNRASISLLCFEQ